MPSSGLHLRGVPVERLHQFTEADATSTGFAFTQVEFDRLRGPGTPLLQDSSSASRGPAPHLRALVIDLLVAAAGGPRAELEGEDALMAYAELRLALIESLAGFLAGFPERAIPPSRTAPPSSLPDRAFTALAHQRPEWLSELAGRSFTRVTGVTAAPPLEVVAESGELPALYVSRASAAWRAQPVLEAEETSLAHRRAERLAAVSEAAPIVFPPPPKPLRRPRPPAEDMDLARSILAARATAQRVIPPQPNNLSALVLERFAPPPAPTGGRDGFVIAPETVATVLAEHDVMVSYVLQPL